MEPALTLQDKENALSYTGTWYDAIKSKDVMLLRALIGVRGNQQLKRQVAILHHAVFDGNKAIVELFIQHGCDVNSRDTVYSRVTPLMEAVRKCDLAICDLLLENGARVDLTDSANENVMHYAARYTSGIFIKRFFHLAEKKGLPRCVLIDALIATNGKSMKPSQLARNAMVQAYIDKQQRTTTSQSVGSSYCL